MRNERRERGAEHFSSIVSAKDPSADDHHDLENAKQTAERRASMRGHELSICRDVVNHLYFGRHPLGGPTPFVFEVSSARNPSRISDIHGHARPTYATCASVQINEITRTIAFYSA